jgi:hypothetical protein
MREPGHKVLVMQGPVGELCCSGRKVDTNDLCVRVSKIRMGLFKGHGNETPVVKERYASRGFLSISDDRGDAVRNVVTWLILPVVICLSQRLSHACLSITKFVLGNCEWLIKSVIVYLMVNCYMDNCGNSRANTCNQAPTSGRGVFIR